MPTTDCEERPAPPPGAPPESRRGTATIYVFLVGLVAPISEIVAGRTQQTGLELAALIGFAAFFIGFVELRRRHRQRRRVLPTLLFVAMATIATLTMRRFGGGWWALYMYVMTTAVSTLPLRWAPWSIAVTASAVAGLALLQHWPLGGALSVAMSIGMAGFVALLLRRRAMMIDELRAANREVARLAAADAVIDERLRIARDLHDLLGHSLSVIALKSELARRLVADDTARATHEIADIEQIARRSLQEVREAVTGYRARTLEAELAHARAALEAAGVRVTTNVAAPALPAELDDLLAWIVREAATNVVRHSRARRAEIELAEADGLARLEIRNDGVSERTASHGNGLAGLRERTAEAGGRLTTQLDGGQFCVTAIIPLEAAP